MSISSSAIMSPEEMIFTFKQGSEESFREAWLRINSYYEIIEPRMTLAFYFEGSILVLLSVIDMLWTLW